MTNSFLANVLEYGFLQRALAGGLLVGAICSALSVFVVLRRMAFIGQGISHAAFGGVALGLLLFADQAEPTPAVNLITAVFCVATALAIGKVGRSARLSEDSAIGIFLVVSMALGVVFLSLRKSFTPDLMGYLFGSLLAISATDLLVIAALAVVVGGALVFLFKELVFITFDEEQARTVGVPAAALHTLLLVLLALTVVMAVKVAGIVLVTAFLVIPGSTARLLARRVAGMVAWALLFGVLSVALGVYLSFLFNIPSGATVVLVQFVAFLGVWGWRGVLGSR